MMKNKIVLYGFYALMLSALVYFLYTKKDMFEVIVNVSSAWLVLLLAFKLLVQIVNGYRYNLVLHIDNIYLKPTVWLALSCVGTLQNAFLPGNTAVISKAVYLKHRFNLGYKRYSILTLVGSVVFILVNSFIVLIFKSELPPVLELTFYVLTALSLLLMLFIVVVDKFKLFEHKFLTYFVEIKDAFIVEKNRNKLIAMAMSECLLIAVRSLALWACFASFGHFSTPIEMMMISIMVSFSSIINLTPGNVGVTESVIIGLSLIYNIPLEIAVASSILSRLSSIVSQFLVVMVFGSRLIDKTK